MPDITLPATDPHDYAKALAPINRDLEDAIARNLHHARLAENPHMRKYHVGVARLRNRWLVGNRRAIRAKFLGQGLPAPERKRKPYVAKRPGERSSPAVLTPLAVALAEPEPVPQPAPAISDYARFIERKSQLDGDHGFDPTWIPEWLFPFQASLVEWATRKGRAAILADCGLGKTPMQLVWAENVHRHTGKPVLILTPLAVAQQTVREAENFGIAAHHARKGEIDAPIVVANYERLHHFSPDDFAGVVCDESSVIKDAKTVTKKAVVAFTRKLPYRLLATATPAPNDYIELGTSSEALGYLGFMDMLERFFKNDQNNSETSRVHGRAVKWRFKGHAETPFWRWVSSWARAMRRPSDLGFSDDGFELPPLIYREHVVTARTVQPGRLFDMPATGFYEARQERRRTLAERIEQASELVANTENPAIIWCHYNDEGDALAKAIPDAVQVSGRDSDDAKEAKLTAFADGNSRVLVTKPVIGAWGLNLQHCSHIVTFPGYSYEQHYQAVRRCWRFGQTNPVTVDIVTSEGEAGVRAILERKAQQADAMFAALVAHMHDSQTIQRRGAATMPTALPSFIRHDMPEVA